MFRSYLAAALRNLVRNRLYAAINIVGLAAGFAAVLLIALFVRDEFSYDRFFPDHRNIYLVGAEVSFPSRAVEHSDFMPAALAPLLKTDFPAIGSMARLAPDMVIVKRGALESADPIHWADSTFFDIFEFQLVAGSFEGVRNDPNSVVITRKAARKYFGRDDPIGETLEFRIPVFEVVGGVTQTTLKSDVFKVAAVIADLPSNTHLNINVVAAARNANSLIARLDNQPPRNYLLNLETYVKLPDEKAATQVQDGLAEFVQRRNPIFNDGPSLKLILRPIASLHLTPSNSRIEKPRGNMKTIYGTIIIGLMIGFAAVINFVNLMTTRAVRRSTEVGVRKTAGAEHRDLIFQFVGEATGYVIVGVACGLALAAIFLPRMNAFLGRTIELGLLTEISSLGFVVALAGIVGVLAGAYPAFVLASIRPAAVLRGALGRRTPSRIRRSLVVLQFAVLIGMLIATGVVTRQTQYALTEAQRLDTDQVVLVMGTTPCMAAFREGLNTIPGVRGAACSSSDGFALNDSATIPAKDTRGTFVAIKSASVGYGFFEFYGLKPIAGRLFSESHSGDTMPADKSAPVQGRVVLNEAAVRGLGFASPHDAIGKSTSLNEETGAPVEIIGVVPDFSADAVHKAVPPTLYVVNHDYQGVLNVRIDGADASATLAAIDSLWKKVGPPQPIARQFLDAVIENRYQDLIRQGKQFTIFAGIASFIAVLGLFGMSAALSEQRTKEIGIRKAMGARERDILSLLVWEFARPVLWANLIAWPFGYFAMRRWLEGFAYHIDLEPWMFLAASTLALAVAVMTVISHATTIARAEPVSALRYE